jgi:hypothetical protein
MIEHFMNGTSHVINIHCDTPGCNRQDSVFSDTRSICISVLSGRGWNFNNEWKHICPLCDTGYEAIEAVETKKEVSLDEYMAIKDTNDELQRLLILRDKQIDDAKEYLANILKRTYPSIQLQGTLLGLISQVDNPLQLAQQHEITARLYCQFCSMVGGVHSPACPNSPR